MWSEERREAKGGTTLHRLNSLRHASGPWRNASRVRSLPPDSQHEAGNRNTPDTRQAFRVAVSDAEPSSEPQRYRQPNNRYCVTSDTMGALSLISRDENRSG